MLRVRAIGSSEGSHLELQARLARRVRERPYAAVIAVAAAVEDDALGAGVLRALGEQLAGAPGLLQARPLAQLGLGPVHGGAPVAAHVVDHLPPDGPVGAAHGQPRTP